MLSKLLHSYQTSNSIIMQILHTWKQNDSNNESRRRTDSANCEYLMCVFKQMYHNNM